MKVLIFHTGSLGDTLVALPAFWAIREHFNNAQIILMCDQQDKNEIVKANEILDNSGLIDDAILYPACQDINQYYTKSISYLNLWKIIRRMKFDILIYLIQSGRPLKSIIRDIIFFKSAGIDKIIGHKGFISLPKKKKGLPLPPVPHQSEQILLRLARDGIKIPHPVNARMDLNITFQEREKVKYYFQDFPDRSAFPYVAIGPGSKMPVKRWPIERYESVVESLIRNYNVWPIIFGGLEDKMLGEKLVQKMGRGYVFAGKLNVREGVAALENCLFYLGNDTGTMHMAVLAGIPCIAIFSSRDYPGNWYPYGINHIVFRTSLECEGCMLEVCMKREMRCILSIDESQVYQAAEKLLLKTRNCGYEIL